MGKNRIFISLFLIATLISATTFNSFASNGNDTTTGLPEFQDDAIVKTIKAEDGGTYYVKSVVDGGIRKVEISSDLNTDVVVVTNDNMEELTFAKYSLEDDGINSTPVDDIYSVDEHTYSIDEEPIQTEVSASLTYGNNYYETYKNKYFYAIGKSDYGNAYMKIGCATQQYAIKYWTLASWQQRKCDLYAQEIRNIRAHTNSAAVYFAGVGVSVDAALIITVGFSIFVPEAVIIAAVLAALGVAGEGVKQIIDARTDYYDAAAMYSIIKTYPHL